MFRILIVDDDFVMRASLRTLLVWEDYGCEIVGEATNGEAAMAFLKKNEADVVITDMSMPVMNGVELIRRVRQYWPEIQIIALSGYADFGYVRESLKYGARDYLLKHQLTAPSLLEVLQSALAQIHQNLQQRRHYETSKRILRQEFIRDMLLGRVKEPSVLRQRVKELDLPLGGHTFMLGILALDDFPLLKAGMTPPEEGRLIASIKDLLADILQEVKQGAMTHLTPGKFILIFAGEEKRSERNFGQFVQTTLSRSMSSLRRYLNISVSCQMSAIFDRLQRCQEIYEQSDMCLRDHMLTASGRLFTALPGRIPERPVVMLEMKDEKAIANLLRRGDAPAVDAYLKVFFHRMAESQAGYKSVQMVCAELISLANRLAKESGIAIMELYDRQSIPYEEMRQYETLEEVRVWLMDVYRRLMKAREVSVEPRDCSSMTQAAIAYIHQHFQQDISLRQAAEHIGVNGSYLSRIFKEDCGIGFKEYLNRVRIRQAKYLLQDSELCLKELVGQSGFNNYTYFFKVFKLLEGVTPVEYKEHCQKTMET